MCVLMNFTGEKLLRKEHNLDHGIWTPDDTAPPLGEEVDSWESESNGFMTGTEGTALYTGPSGSVKLWWNNPFVGSNKFSATPSGKYFLRALEGPATGSNVTVLYMIDKVPDPAPAAAEPEPAAAPPAPAAPAAPEDHTNESHVPKAGGSLTVVSPKAWLIDIAWQVVNNLEWNDTILEITENRHGEQSGATCDGTLLPQAGVAEGADGKCGRPHQKLREERDAVEAQYNAKVAALRGSGKAQKDAEAEARSAFPQKLNDFHSWCGDFVTWLFWKAWMLKNKPAKVTQEELGKFLNRETINGKWAPGENLSMVEAYARGITTAQLKKSQLAGTPSGLLVFHEPKDGYAPKPGDIFMANRAAGGHISIVASYEETASYDATDKKQAKPWHRFVTLDGKSFDMADDGDLGWLQEAKNNGVTMPGGKAQGVAQTHRTTRPGQKDALRGFIDASKLREALGYR